MSGFLARVRHFISKQDRWGQHQEACTGRNGQARRVHTSHGSGTRYVGRSASQSDRPSGVLGEVLPTIVRELEATTIDLESQCGETCIVNEANLEDFLETSK